MFTQVKAVRDASSQKQIKQWRVDTNSLTETIPWTGHSQVLARELEEMQAFFPLFIATVAKRNSIIKCRRCGDLIVWKDGLECIGCGELYSPPANPQLAFIGQIPSIIGEFDDRGRLVEGKCRPVLEKIIGRLNSGSARDRLIFEKYIRVTNEGEYYFTPTVKCFYPYNWPRQAPVVKLEKEYFQVLDIPRQHTFPGRRRR